MTFPYCKTRTAAQRIGATIPQLLATIRSGKLAPPEKDESGDYVWTEEDLERARQALAVDRRRKQHQPKHAPACVTPETVAAPS